MQDRKKLPIEIFDEAGKGKPHSLTYSLLKKVICHLSTTRLDVTFFIPIIKKGGKNG